MLTSNGRKKKYKKRVKNIMIWNMSADQIKILDLQSSKKELKIKLVLAFCDTSNFVSKHCQLTRKWSCLRK